jgi:hypothetical protein
MKKLLLLILCASSTLSLVSMDKKNKAGSIKKKLLLLMRVYDPEGIDLPSDAEYLSQRSDPEIDFDRMLQRDSETKTIIDHEFFEKRLEAIKNDEEKWERLNQEKALAQKKFKKENNIITLIPTKSRKNKESNNKKEGDNI